jgi:hypothetical protein
VCRQTQKWKELFEFWKLEEGSTEVTFAGLLNTWRLSERLLEQMDKIRRASAFAHVVVTARSAEAEELFGGVQSTQISGRAVSAVRSDKRKRSGPLGFYVQEELRRSLQKEETDSRRIS